MGNGITSKRWPLFVLGSIAIAFYLYGSIELIPPTPPRVVIPIGTSDDVQAIADRDDVNILFILVDTLRADRMSVYGYERETTPFLSHLSKTSVRFDRHVAQSSWTKSSVASLWTAMNPLRAGITKFDQTLSQDARLPAEILSDEGFLTVGLYRNGWVHGYFGFDQGFDKYFRPLGSWARREVQRVRPNELSHGTDENLIEEAIEFLNINGRRSRWFLYLHLMDLHEYIYDEESALFGNATSDLYDNSIRRTDWLISILYDYLEQSGLLDETIIVLLSDHGEAFGERGFEGHAREVLPETTETPLILTLPFSLESSPVVSTLTSNVDIWPTLFELLGLPGQEGVDGRSRVNEIIAAVDGPSGQVGEIAADAEPVIAYLDENWGRNVSEVRPAVSVLQGPYRFVSGTNAAGTSYEALFLQEDGQKQNQIVEYPEVADRLREIALNHLEEKSAFGVETIEMDEMQLNQLRALGYELP